MCKVSVPVPAHLKIIVDTLGEDDAVAFLLAFGGGRLRIGASPQSNNPVRKELGDEIAHKLAAVSDRLSSEIPLGKQWVAKVLKSKGLSNAEIARRLHQTEGTVRRHLKNVHDPNGLKDLDDPGRPGQLNLF